MKFLKTFEEIDNEPEVGDYVVCEDSSSEVEGGIIPEFTLSHVGVIIDKYKEWDLDIGARTMDRYGVTIVDGDGNYLIKYDISELKLKELIWAFPDGTRGMNRSEIKFHSKNKKEAEEFINTFIFSKTYNL